MSRLSVGALTTLLVVSVLAPGAVGGAAAQDDPVVVTLSVVDSDGDSVGGVNLTVSWAGGSKNASTLANGNAYVEVPNGSDIEIHITDDEYIRNRVFERSNVGEEEIEVPVSLAGQATVAVQTPNGSPVSGAEVTVTRSGLVETLTTDRNGKVTTPRIERGDYDLTVSKSGFFENDAATLELDESEVNSTVELRRGRRSVTFRVVDDHFDPERPLENSTVAIPQRYSSRTFGDGTTSTTIPVNREYTVEVSKPGYTNTTREFSVQEQAVEVELAIRRVAELDVQVSSQRVIVNESTLLTVTDEYGDPVEGAIVTADASSVGRTDSEGEIAVPVSSEGNVTISVSDGRVTESVTVEGFATGSDETPDETPDETVDETTATPTETDEPTTEPDNTDTETETDADTAGATETAGGDGPGFGVALALVALVAALLFARHR